VRIKAGSGARQADRYAEVRKEGRSGEGWKTGWSKGPNGAPERAQEAEGK